VDVRRQLRQARQRVALARLRLHGGVRHCGTLFLRVSTGPDISGPLPYGADLTSTGLTSTGLTSAEHNLVATAGTRDWISRELTVAVPGDGDAVVFGIFLEGRGEIEFRHAELVRSR
jgi:hypothetical protein